MSKSKSGFVAMLVAVMMGLIVFAAYRLYMPAFIVLVAIFSVTGFLTVADLFWNWLQVEPDRKDSAMLPASSNFKFAADCDELSTDAEEIAEDFESTFDKIKKEVESA